MAETLFKEVRYDLGSLMKFIELGEIGLPDIQRPFVWKNSKIRDLFDSMYRGYPVGYFLFWQNGAADDSKPIGTETKQKTPRLLIVDGQQRLTSLYAVIYGIPVIRDDYSNETIVIGFNPVLETFVVADATTPRDKSYLPNISLLWDKSTDLFGVVADYLDGLKQVREISDDEAKRIRKAIAKLHGLLSFPFTALELSSSADEEQVADVFVRINSKGKSLNQADFILTLMSVFWDDGRAELEHFCRGAKQPALAKASPFNHFIQPSPDQLLRVNVGIAFKRARLQHVYSILRGKDLETEEFSIERRDQQFEVLKAAQRRTLNLQFWHDFLKTLLAAGYRSAQNISSDNVILFSYILYLLGRTEYKIEESRLRHVIAQWFFMSSLTARYSSSPESKMEFDLARFRNVRDANAFVGVLSKLCEEALTDDYWDITLPGELATASPRSPALFAYFASLNLLEARVLFSKLKVSELMDPATKAKRSAIERHHLFPKKFLKEMGITEQREMNQNANLALVEWADNHDIDKEPPDKYLPIYRAKYSAAELDKMYFWHALPNGWEKMPYEAFLEKRREKMAAIIKRGYEVLISLGETVTKGESRIDIEELVSQGEHSTVEFKSALRTSLHTRQSDARIEMGIVKTIAGFLNASGGTLVIGVADDSTPVGLDHDRFQSEDKMRLHLENLIKDRMGPQFMMYVHPRFEEYKDTRVLAVECWPSDVPNYVKDGNAEKFFIRTGASTSELTPSQTVEYVKRRFKRS
jgi:hypothetical protein